MEHTAQLFFAQFVELTWTMRWLLGALFVTFLVRELIRIKSSDRIEILLMFFYFFLVITSYWVLKPIKKALFVGYHNINSLNLFGWELGAAQAELVAKEVNMLIAIVAAIMFALFSRRFRRQHLTYIVGSFFIVGFLCFSVVLQQPGIYSIWAFYLFGDLFITIMVATFFAFLNDCEEPLSARKVYGLIGFGGVSGGFFGSSIVANSMDQLSASQSTFIGMGITMVIIIIAGIVGQRISKHPPREWPSSEPEVTSKTRLGQAFEGARLVFKSRYFFSIMLIVALYEVVSTILDFQFTTTVVHFVPGDQLAVFFSQVFSFTNFASLVVQLFLTGFVLRRFGVGAALLVLPLTILSGSLAFFIAPVLIVGSLLNTMDNAFSYSINQSAKETLYTSESRDNKYKAKAFIDIFMLRFAKAVAVLLSLAFTAIFTAYESIHWLSLVVFCFLIIWFIAVRHVGQSFAIKEKGNYLE